MSKTFKNVFAKSALDIFNTHKELDLIHVTSDGQGFTKDNKNKAHDHARYLKDDRVETFERGFEDTYTESEETDSLEAENDIEPSAAEKNALISKYKELYGVAPAHNIGLEKLKAKITEKEAEGKEPGSDPVIIEQKEVSEDKGTAEHPEA